MGDHGKSTRGAVAVGGAGIPARITPDMYDTFQEFFNKGFDTIVDSLNGEDERRGIPFSLRDVKIQDYYGNSARRLTKEQMPMDVGATAQPNGQQFAVISSPKVQESYRRIYAQTLNAIEIAEDQVRAQVSDNNQRETALQDLAEIRSRVEDVIRMMNNPANFASVVFTTGKRLQFGMSGRNSAIHSATLEIEKMLDAKGAGVGRWPSVIARRGSQFLPLRDAFSNATVNLRMGEQMALSNIAFNIGSAIGARFLRSTTESANSYNTQKRQPWARNRRVGGQTVAVLND